MNCPFLYHLVLVDVESMTIEHFHTPDMVRWVHSEFATFSFPHLTTYIAIHGLSESSRLTTDLRLRSPAGNRTLDPWLMRRECYHLATKLTVVAFMHSRQSKEHQKRQILHGYIMGVVLT